MQFEDKFDFSWQSLKQKGPIIGLSPMDGVTDAAYRLIQKKYGQPDVVFSEFVNVEGLCHKGIKLMHHFLYQLQFMVDWLELEQKLGWPLKVKGVSERPVIAQIYGKTPTCFYQAALLAMHLGFDGVDINMGCPAKNVAKSGAGAGLIKTPTLAAEVVAAVKRARDDYRAGANLDQAPDISDEIKQLANLIRQLAFGKTEVLNLNRADLISDSLPAEKEQVLRLRPLPVSVKTRIGYERPVTKSWTKHLLSLGIDALTLHGRTLRQAYTGRADWQEIYVAAELARQAGVVFLGNGDVLSYEQAYEKVNQFQVDGVLIGRASFGNPFVFRPKDFKPPVNLFQVAVEHAFIYEKMTKTIHQLFDLVTSFEKIRLISDENLFLPMRKHLAWYVKGVPQAKKLRSKLMQTHSAEEVRQILSHWTLRV